MKTSPRWFSVLAIVFWLSGWGQAQTENGFPQCRPDGSPPNGESQCECALRFFGGDYRDPEHEYWVQLPDNVIHIPNGCSPGGRGFRISLTRSHGGEPGGDFAWNLIWVVASERRKDAYPELINGIAKAERETSEEIRATDLKIDQPEQTLLDSLPAIHLKVSRTEPDNGKMIYEHIIANTPKKDIVYFVSIISPAFRYEKAHQLFEEVVAGFHYIPTEDSETH